MIAAVVCLCIVAPVLLAWDEVSHAKIGEMAIDLVQDAELRRILDENRDVLRFGTWFPDWGQYAGKHPFDEGSHREVVAAYIDYIAQPAVRRQENWELLVAHAFGAYGHSVMDFYMDSTLYTYMRELDNGMSGDMGNGIMYIRRYGYLGLPVDAAYPYADLRRMYESIGFFERYGRRPADFVREIDRHTKVQFLQMRGLKLLSFLASDYIQSRMPWGAANAFDAPGGHRDTALATARVWDALWDEIQSRPTRLFVHSLPPDGGVLPSPNNESMYGRITLLARKSVDPAVVEGALRLVDEEGRDVPGAATVYPYSEDEYADFAVQFIPAEPMKPEAVYTLTVAAGDYGIFSPAYTAGLEIDFSVARQPDTSSPPRRQGYRMGLFLLLLLGSIGGILFGASGAIAAAYANPGTTGEDAPPPVPRVAAIARRVLEVLGVALVAAGLALFFAKGTPFIRLLMDIF